MILTDAPHCLLYIEPQRPRSAQPTVNNFTEFLDRLMEVAVWRARDQRERRDIPPTERVLYGIVGADGSWTPRCGTRGVHVCVCGAMSFSYDIYLGYGLFTNSLAMHYLQYHWDEVPEEERRKLSVAMVHRSAGLNAASQSDEDIQRDIDAYKARRAEAERRADAAAHEQYAVGYYRRQRDAARAARAATRAATRAARAVPDERDADEDHGDLNWGPVTITKLQ